MPLRQILNLLPLFLPLILILTPPCAPSPLLLRTHQSSQPVFGTERFRRSPSSGPLTVDHLRNRLPHSTSLVLPQLYSAPRLRPLLPAPSFRQWDPVDPYRAFVEQELMEQPDQGSLQDSPDDAYYGDSPYEGRALARMPADGAQAPFMLSPGYLQYNPAPSSYRPAPAWRSQDRWRASPGDPVDDLEEEMRREEDAMGWVDPRWGGSDELAEDDQEAAEEAEEEEAEEEEAERRRDAEAERREAEAAERAKTEGAFVRNLILAQRYREDALSPPVGSESRKGYRYGGIKRSSVRRVIDSGDRAVKELESLARKSSEKRADKAMTTPTTEATPVKTTDTPTVALTNSQRGQKEVAVPRPASPPRRPPESMLSAGGINGKWVKEATPVASSKGSVLEALERLLEEERDPSRRRLGGGGQMQKRFVSGEDVMMRQLNELKRA